MNRRRWPFRGDLPADRRAQVCLQYRRALRAVDPETCDVIDHAAVEAGETWVREELAIEMADDLVTVPRAAELVGRSVRWVYEWAHRNRHMIRGTGPIMVRLGDVQAAVGYERMRRARDVR